MKWLVACVAAVMVGGAAASAAPPRGSITIDRIAEIKYPTAPAWSPDGRQVAFLWDAAGKQDLFVVTPGQQPIALTSFPVDPDLLVSDISHFAWVTSDSILFAKDGQLWSVATASRTPVRVPGMADVSSFALSPDRKTIAFVRRGQISVGSIAARTERQLSAFGSSTTVLGLSYSTDGRWLAFTTSQNSLQAENLPWNGDRVRSYEPAPVTDRRLGVISVEGGDPWWIPAVGTISGVQWTAGGTVLFQEVSPDGKTREIKTAAVGQAPRTLWRDHDERWWSPTTRDSKILVSPNGRFVAFVSDRSGWIHIYVMPVDATSEAQARQLTSGTYLAGLGSWSPDSHRIAYHRSAVGDQMERFIDVVDADTGRSEPVVKAPGVNLDPLISPDNRQVVYQRTDVENSLDLYVASLQNGTAPVRLSDSMPPGLLKTDLTPPVAVQFPSRLDGKPVPAALIVSKTIDRSRKNPALVWIHGSGSDQNFLGWHPGSYRMYYSLCEYLAQQGYVILTPDYRGSSGYSREWSTGVYMSIGVGDTADVASGADYLKTLPYVDPDRIGVFGLSYGGFLTLQALTTDPTLWRAGVDVAGVVDWATYPAGYTTPRLGTPVDHPDIYKISAPIYHLDKLERPLLILHGTNDRNVAFRDSLRAIDVLEKLRKDFQMAIYPGEIHFFRRAHVLRDAWRRIEAFFDGTLMQPGVAATQ